MNAATHDIIALQDLRVKCLVGIHPHERITPLPLMVQLKLYFERKPGHFGRTLAESLDYSFVCGTWRSCWKRRNSSCWKRRWKPSVPAHDAAAGPPEHSPGRRGGEHPKASGPRRQSCAGGHGAAARGRNAVRHRHNDFGHVDILHENQDCGVYLLHIPAGGQIQAHIHKVMGEANWSCRVGCCSKASLLTAALPTCGRSSSCTSTTAPPIPPARSCASTVQIRSSR